MLMDNIEKLAEEAFLKREILENFRMMNTPVNFEDRKNAFIALAKARAEAVRAQKALDDAIELCDDAIVEP
jgi:hypothetical protein